MSRRARLLGTSAAINDVRARILLLAESDLTVTILGQTGVGKDVSAQLIHLGSARRDGPCVTLTCTGIPESIAESELFGHERGAFTGADRMKRGSLELAHGGVVFLDEIGDLSLANQGRLLRVLETRRVRRVGGSEEIPIDVRVLTATHRNLKAEVERGAFRRDLFYRVMQHRLIIPPLDERKEDIRPIVCGVAAEEGFLGILDEDIFPHLVRRRWPGNVRELLSYVRAARYEAGGASVNAALLAKLDETTAREDLEWGFDESGPEVAARRAIEAFLLLDSKIKMGKGAALELMTLEAARHLAKENQRGAARLLQMDDSTYREKLLKLQRLRDVNGGGELRSTPLEEEN